MFARLTNILSRLQISSSFNFSRNIAAATAGSFFGMGNILKIPLNKFLDGMGPAITTFVVSGIVFFSRLKNNYMDSDPDSLTGQFIKSENTLSTKMIMEMLKKNDECTAMFLQNFNIDDKDIRRIKNWTVDNNDELQDIWNHLYNEMQWGLEKYTVSAASSLMLISCHYMEIMLLKVYSPELFKFENDWSFENTSIYLLAFVAFLNGIVEFFNVKDAYENPAKGKLCDSIAEAYNTFQTSHQQHDEDDLKSVRIGK